jgi:hypothetical protein
MFKTIYEYVAALVAAGLTADGCDELIARLLGEVPEHDRNDDEMEVCSERTIVMVHGHNMRLAS